ncbi:DNA-directed DNA polymerase II small subunit [Candidatus Woesearchaeota archaeon]|nr:DNA-directed DNA polymerase II small subunit [Candidatus Woesearchaeota archaeon]
MSLEIEQKKREIVGFLVAKGVLVDPGFLEKLKDEESVKEMHAKLEQNPDPEQLMESASQEDISKKPESKVKVLWEYKTEYNKRKIQDFVNYFNARYKLLERMLVQRPEMQNLTSIARLINKQDKETVSIVGMVSEKRITKNGNMFVKVEDRTGQINVIFSKNKPELIELAKDLVNDEVIGIVGSTGENIVFANTLLFPDIPLQTELKKSPDEAYALVLSDLHVGSIWFEKERFERFLKWIRGEAGDESQKEIARKVKYIFIPGDLIDGIGIYPGMEAHLTIKDVYEQYEECAKLLKQIPEHIWLIICPGNHDVGRMAEPQPHLPKEYTKQIWDMPNVIMTCNPSFINIHSSEDFSGFNFLVYHGYSYDYYAQEVESIKNSGMHLSDRVGLVMKFMLQRRHLAPSHATTLYIPDAKTDPLVIETVPDFFISGHVHKAAVTSYRGVSIICGSCWQGQTEFQDKVGHEAEPGKVPMINLKTRKIKLMKF